MLAIQVAHALPSEQAIINLRVSPGTTVRDAVVLSGIHDRFPQLAAAHDYSYGIYGKVVDAETSVRSGDRIEIYRKLLADPKQARRQRAAASRRPR